MVEAVATFSAIGAILLFWALVRLKRSKHILITDFQCGVRFQNGAFRDVLEHGSYVIDSIKEQVVVVDLRPRPILVERIGYQDALQSPSIISIAGTLLVANAQVAATKLKDPVNDSFPIVRDALLNCVKQSITDESPTGRQQAAENITKASNVELAKVGMRIANAEITELWSRPMQAGVATNAN
jgi:hypothetical protein